MVSLTLVIFVSLRMAKVVFLSSVIASIQGLLKGLN